MNMEDLTSLLEKALNLHAKINTEHQEAEQAAKREMQALWRANLEDLIEKGSILSLRDMSLADELSQQAKSGGDNLQLTASELQRAVKLSQKAVETIEVLMALQRLLDEGNFMNEDTLGMSKQAVKLRLKLLEKLSS
jgi:hypothetical protein